MTTALCPSCSGAVSPKAFDCPHCGHPIRKPRRGLFGGLVKILFIVFNLAMLVWTISALGTGGQMASDALTDADRMGAEIGTALAFGLILSIWAAGAVVLGLLMLLTRPRK